MSKNRPDVVLNLRVEFSGFSGGEGTVRIGFRVRKEHLNVVAAEDSFCGRRLTGRIVVTPGRDAAAQTYIEGTDASEGRHEISGTFDVKRYASSPKWISSGLTFNLEEIDVREVGHFSKQSGYLIVDNVGEIPAKAKKPAKAKVTANGKGRRRGGGGGDASGNGNGGGGDELVPVRSQRTSPKGGAKRRNGQRMMAKAK